MAGGRILSGGVGVPGHVAPTPEKSGEGRRSVSLHLKPVRRHGVNQNSTYASSDWGEPWEGHRG